MSMAPLSPEEGVNLEATYLAIGGASPDSRVEHREGYSVCLGQLDHPIGNFAIVRRLTPFTASELAAAAKSRTSFNVYVPSGPSSAQTARALRAAGFRPSYRLSAMRCAQSPRKSDCALLVADTDLDRLRVAHFMVKQFFPKQDAAVRAHIAQATADCGLELCEILRYGTMIGATMISRTGGLFGIYNLCIEKEKRGRGLGSDALARLLDQAASERLDAVLQADPALEPWYLNRGFSLTGGVEVYK